MEPEIDAPLPQSPFRILDLFVLVLSVYVLVALLADTFLKLPHEVSRMLNMIDNGICVFFLYEFAVRFKQAPNKWRFMQWGWIDLISSIPATHYLHAGRAIRLVRIVRILRAFRSVRHIIGYLFKKRTQGAFATAAIAAVVLVLSSSVAILELETDPNSNIKTAEDALWWAYVTITTVGYGDKYPVTSGGRLLAALLMTAGVGLFGTFTGFVSSWFVAQHKEPEQRKEKV